MAERLSAFEREIVNEFWLLTKKRLRAKDLLEWRLGSPVTVQAGEQVVHLPSIKVWVAVPDSIKIKTAAV